MTTAAPPATPKTKQTTEYVVLREIEDASLTTPNPSSAIIGTFAAKSANEAIKKAAGEKAGVYRAVPSRSWKPVKVTVHTETTIRLA